MAIDVILPPGPHREISFIEDDPPDDAKARLGNFFLRRIEASELDDDRRVAKVAAAVLRQRSDRPSKVIEQLQRYAPVLLDYGCRVFVAPTPITLGAMVPPLRPLIVKAIDSAKLPASGLGAPDVSLLGDWYPGIDSPLLVPTVHVLASHDAWDEVADYLQAYPPPQALSSDASIDARDGGGRELILSGEQSLLIRRAFANCREVRLQAVTDGRSNVLAFRAYVFLRMDLGATKVPYEYFVKLGDRDKISKEYLAYRHNALEHLPYHLGPRLRLDRCALGAREGIIVSDYVRGAEKLRDCARANRAVPVIASLFHTTLRRWRDGARTIDQPLHERLLERLPAAIPDHRRKLIEDLGASKSPSDFRMLVNSRSTQPFRAGVVHGDLHALNVLVRGGDAIVIDFEKVESEAPLLRDLASLEGGLLVDGFAGDSRSGTEIMRSIECLYDGRDLCAERSQRCHPGDPSAWYFDCVEEIRRQARYVEMRSGQYGLALAVELAMKACNPTDFRDSVRGASGAGQEEVRAVAYVLAERILVKADIRIPPVE